MTRNGTITLFLCGDVMPGRGIDQILPHPGDPTLHEPYVRNALGYVQLAERVSGPLDRRVAPGYIWGDALTVLTEIRPDLRLINLETSITTSDDYQPKGINYRLHPRNRAILTAAGIHCCILANNHVLDWGESGLLETLQTLEQASIKQAGAGRNLRQAELPAILAIPDKGRVLVFAWGSPTSGIPENWAAGPARPGINLLPDLSDASLRQIKKILAAARQPGDIVLVSLHWGGNWGYAIPREQQHFARGLIDEAGADLVYGHSSHHVKGIEVYRQKLILYGCGDFLNDYEGISGYEQFRGDLTLMYFPRLCAATGQLLELRMVPMRISRFQTVRSGEADARWLGETLNREGAVFKTRVLSDRDNSLDLLWCDE